MVTKHAANEPYGTICHHDHVVTKRTGVTKRASSASDMTVFVSLSNLTRLVTLATGHAWQHDSSLASTTVARWDISDVQWHGGISRTDSGMVGYLGWKVAWWDISDGQWHGDISRIDSGKVVYPRWTVARWDISDGQWQGGVSRMGSGKVGYLGWTVE